MNKDNFEGEWKQIRGEAKAWWGKLTDNDLDWAAGKFDGLASLLQEKYGFTRQRAAEEIDQRVADYETGLKNKLHKLSVNDMRVPLPLRSLENRVRIKKQHPPFELKMKTFSLRRPLQESYNKRSPFSTFRDRKCERMNIPSDKYKSDGKHLIPFSGGLQTLLGIGEWLIWFFTLTEKERMEAGIQVGQASVREG